LGARSRQFESDHSDYEHGNCLIFRGMDPLSFCGVSDRVLRILCREKGMESVAMSVGAYFEESHTKDLDSFLSLFERAEDFGRIIGFEVHILATEIRVTEPDWAVWASPIRDTDNWSCTSTGDCAFCPGDELRCKQILSDLIVLFISNRVYFKVEASNHNPCIKQGTPNCFWKWEADILPRKYPRKETHDQES
jgi:hypothetical protein